MDEIRCAVEIREDESRLGPGRLYGVLMAYGKMASDRREIFEAGSLKWDTAGIVVNRQHERSSPIMRVVPIESEGRLMIDQRLPDSTAGRDCAVEVRAGLLTGLSIEFRSVRQTFVNGVRRITEAVLSAAAIVDSPSYSSSTVEVRAKPRHKRQIWL